MKRIFLSAVLLASGLVAMAANQAPMWENAAVNQQNRLDRRADYFAFESESKAQQMDKTQSSRFLSIEGNWQFHFAKNRNERPTGFFSTTFDDSAWGTMPVPGIIELNGYGQPCYVNVGYAWENIIDNNPPVVGDIDNYVGSYRRTIDLPASWKGQSVYLHIGSATSNLQVWVNGKYVGYSEDSKVAAEFDITRFVRPGRNLIAMQVMRWCDGSYVEGQDFWRLTGIARECYLYARPKQHVGDIVLNADLASDLTTGLLHFSTDRAVNLRLVDKDGKEVARTQGKQGAITLPNVYPWTAETPYLYTLFVSASNGSEVIPFRVGFRHIEIRGEQVLVNGQPILIKGANRHELSPEGGYVVSLEQMIEDIRIMKALNMNAVRTCHYSDDPRWYDLCDEYGLYVVAEANFEAHAMGFFEQSLAKNPMYRTTLLEREEANVKPLRNHPSIIFWSLGNESGLGDNMYAGYRLVKQLDPTRPVQYECDRVSLHDASDIIGPMYPDLDSIRRAVNLHSGKPVIPCEYAHAMGNSMGGFEDYWRLVRELPEYQGGYIWDLIDQGLSDRSLVTGNPVFTYGGDYDEYPASSYNFNCNGVIAPDRRLNPHAFEVAYIHQNVWVTDLGLAEGRFEVFNEYFFRATDNLYLELSLLADGQPVGNTIRIDDVTVAPQQRRTFTCKALAQSIAEASTAHPQAELLVNFTFRTRRAEGLVAKDQIDSHQQFTFRAYDFTSVQPDQSDGAIRVEDTKSFVRFFAGNTTVAVGKQSGLIDYLYVNGQPLLRFRESIVPDFWRAPTDNDYGAQLQHVMGVWRNPARTLTDQTITDADGAKIVRSTFSMPEVKASLVLTYTIYPSGQIAIREQLIPDADAQDVPDMFRFGLAWQMPEQFAQLSYYGRGPEENYIDRKNSAFLGHYTGAVADEFFPYVRPQECGNHCDVRRFTVFDATTGCGLRIDATGYMEASALPYATESLDDGPDKTHKRGSHSGDLVPDHLTQLHVCGAQYGLGCINSWWEKPMEQYRLHFGPQEFSVLLTPIVK